ncbi:MAG: class I SAM-dependent methyltransferase [Saprospiraceae bacterium]|nr:class I SAM-dependent methyltransferase [Candidatus Opimibacter iunctus]
MGWTYTAIQFGSHLLRSRRWDSFHSPSLFRLFTHCCNEQIRPEAYTRIERERDKLKNSTALISRKDFGAGSKYSPESKIERISAIASHALSLPFQCRFLSRLAGFIQPEVIVEFGTSLGISASYLGVGAPGARIFTVEGDPEVSEVASSVFETLGLNNIAIQTSSFDQYIACLPIDHLPIDLLFLDGHHTSAATIYYYQALRKYLHSGSIVIIDDLYWSADMQAGWQALIALPEVTQSVDCFHFGLLFLNPDFQQKENHTIRLPLKMHFQK